MRSTRIPFLAKIKIARIRHSVLSGLVFVSAVVLLSGAPLHALQFSSWSGSPIEGERSELLPSGSAEFNIISGGSRLTITLTNDTPQVIQSTGEVLSGLTWDITSGVSLSPVSALIAAGSRLVGFDSGIQYTDLSSEWFFKDNISAGESYSGPIGSFGIGTVGDVNLGKDTFGPNDSFDTSPDLFGPEGPNGIEVGIVGAYVDLTSGGFPNHGPVVQGWHDTNTQPGQMIFTFNVIVGSLTADNITNVQPLFGTDGATVVPEPATLLLFGIGLVGLAGFKKRFKK